MRRLSLPSILALAALAGCVFGDDRDNGDDQPPGGDAAPGSLQIVSVELPDTETEETSTFLATLSGRPNETVAFTIASSGGTFSPAMGATVIDASGTGLVASQYTAPAEAGNFAHIFTATDERDVSVTRPFAAIVNVAEVRVGNADPLPDSFNWSANYLLAQHVDLPRDATVLRLGVIGTGGATRAKMALYRDAGGAPGARVKNTTPFMLDDGVTELEVAPSALPEGRYWIAIVLESNGFIGQDDLAPQTTRYASSYFSNPLPATFPPSNAYSYGRLNFYLVVDYD